MQLPDKIRFKTKGLMPIKHRELWRASREGSAPSGPVSAKLPEISSRASPELRHAPALAVKHTPYQALHATARSCHLGGGTLWSSSTPPQGALPHESALQLHSSSPARSGLLQTLRHSHASHILSSHRKTNLMELRCTHQLSLQDETHATSKL
jgi:hypothetical protein